MFPIADAAMDHVDAANVTAIRYGVASLLFLGLLAAVEGVRALRYDGRFRRAWLFGTIGFARFHPPGFVGVAFAGVALVVVGDNPAAAAQGGVGDLLVLLGAMCWVRYTLSAAGEFGGWSPLRFTALSASAGTLTIVAIAAAGDLSGLLSTPTAGDLGAAGWGMGYIVLFGALIAVLAWNSGVQRIGPANAALFMNLVPVTTFTIQAFRGATPGPVELAGAAVTLAALIGANATLRVPARAPVTNVATSGA